MTELEKAALPQAPATTEPVTLGPLAKRNIYDAIRGAYDLGYNDARNARSVPGDSAPGYDGRSVEEDHGSALFSLLSKRLNPATTERKGEPSIPAGWVACRIEHEPGYPEDVAYGPQRMMDRLKKWLDKHFANTSPQAPEGFALVPVEPTPKMIQRVRWLEYTESSLRMSPVDDDTVRAVWSDVIDAARKGE